MSSRIIRPSKETAGKIGAFKFNELYPSAAPPAQPDAEQTTPAPAAATARPMASAATATATQRQAVPASAPGGPRPSASEIEKEAYETGFAAGQKAGSEVGERMSETMLKQYSKTLEELNKLRKEILSGSEREVIRLALEVAKKIVHREVTVDNELIVTLVKVTLKRVSGQSLVTVRLSPRDFHTIGQYQAANPTGELSESVKLLEDPAIGRGGCIIETESGTIDARIEEQLREIEKGFLE